MKVLKQRTAPRYIRQEGIVSYLLASPRTSDAQHLTTSVVEIEPGGEQRIHSHLPEQVYYILVGSGVMMVGDEKARVDPGDCIFIPSGAAHGLRNDGRIALRYFSAAAPSFGSQRLESLWPLKSEAHTRSTAGETSM
jgi:mannose-6-phosphate isomerase-like protein (cupin superfamily)